MERKNTIMINVTVIFLAVTVILGASQPAFAQFTNFQQNFVHANWNAIPPQGFPLGPGIPPDTFGADQTNFPLFQGIPTLLFCSSPTSCVIELQNLEDTLDNKNIFVSITFQSLAPQQLPLISTICFDPTGDTAGITIFEGPDNQNPFSYIYDIECMPNPDWEQMRIDFNTPSEFENILSIEVWTETFDDAPVTVGGSFVPIDQSALLLAGVQSISMWMIPVVIAGIGIGIFVIKRRN